VDSLAGLRASADLLILFTDVRPAVTDRDILFGTP
jgi:hypothetical protein